MPSFRRLFQRAAALFFAAWPWAFACAASPDATFAALAGGPQGFSSFPETARAALWLCAMGLAMGLKSELSQGAPGPSLSRRALALAFFAMLAFLLACRWQARAWLGLSG